MEFYGEKWSLNKALSYETLHNHNVHIIVSGNRALHSLASNPKSFENCTILGWIFFFFPPIIATVLILSNSSRFGTPLKNRNEFTRTLRRTFCSLERVSSIYEYLENFRTMWNILTSKSSPLLLHNLIDSFQSTSARSPGSVSYLGLPAEILPGESLFFLQ